MVHLNTTQLYITTYNYIQHTIQYNTNMSLPTEIRWPLQDDNVDKVSAELDKLPHFKEDTTMLVFEAVSRNAVKVCSVWCV